MPNYIVYALMSLKLATVIILSYMYTLSHIYIYIYIVIEPVMPEFYFSSFLALLIYYVFFVENNNIFSVNLI